MLHEANHRWPRVLVGQGSSGLSKCTKCGLAFVAKHPAQHTCSKCTVSRRRKSSLSGQAAKPHKGSGLS